MENGRELEKEKSTQKKGFFLWVTSIGEVENENTS